MTRKSARVSPLTGSVPHKMAEGLEVSKQQGPLWWRSTATGVPVPFHSAAGNFGHVFPALNVLSMFCQWVIAWKKQCSERRRICQHCSHICTARKGKMVALPKSKIDISHSFVPLLLCKHNLVVSSSYCPSLCKIWNSLSLKFGTLDPSRAEK